MELRIFFGFIHFSFRNTFDLTNDCSNIMKILVEKENNDLMQVILINRKGAIYRYNGLKHFFDRIIKKKSYKV